MAWWLVLGTLTLAGLPTGKDLAAVCLPSERSELTAQDGSQTEDWGGTGQVQVRISKKFMEQRDEQLAQATAVFTRINKLFADVDTATDRKTRAELKLQFEEFADKPLDEAKEAMLQAVELERKRLQMVDKALRKSAQHKAEIPMADPGVVQNLLLEIDSGAPRERVETHINAYASLLRGMAAFLGNDLVLAMKQMELATRTLPELALAHQYLGSFYFLARAPKKALSEWREALRLDPTNTALEQAIAETEDTLPE